MNGSHVIINALDYCISEVVLFHVLYEGLLPDHAFAVRIAGINDGF